MLHALGLLLGGCGLLWAMVSDVRRYIIPDPVHALVLLGAGLSALGLALSWQEGALRLGVGLIGFIAALLLFARGWLGGGDVKLITVCLLWVSPRQSLEFLLIMALAGAVLALAVLVKRGLSRSTGPTPLPYSLAIAAAWAVCVLPRMEG